MVPPFLYELGERSVDLSVTDLNNDGWPDIVSSNMTVFLNRFADRLGTE
jgi:hypothetical protein